MTAGDDMGPRASGGTVGGTAGGTAGDLVPLHDPATGVMRIVGLMSGSGTNLRRLLELQKELDAGHAARATGTGTKPETKPGTKPERKPETGPQTKRETGPETAAGTGSPFEVVVIFTDQWGSNAARIGAEYDVPVVVRDIAGWYSARGYKRGDLGVRAAYDEETVKALEPWKAKVAAYAGYMSIATPALTGAFLGVNVHPADLSVVKGGGQRRFVGDHAIREAILAGERAVHATTHLVEEQVDGGRLLLVSPPVEVHIPPGADLGDRAMMRSVESDNQERLKQGGDWIVFPRTILWIAQGRFASGTGGTVYLDGEPIPNGRRLHAGAG